jgi:uncharacterized membrane protein
MCLRRYTAGTVVDLGTFGGPFSAASDVNNHGQVVSVAQNGIVDPFDNEQGATIWAPGPVPGSGFSVAERQAPGSGYSGR